MKDCMHSEPGKPKIMPVTQVKTRLAVLAVGVVFIAYVLVSCSSPPDAPVKTQEPFTLLPANSDESAANEIKSLTNSIEGSPELAKFTHWNDYHSQLSCLICHRRDTNASTIGFPGKDGHTPCIGCHTQQFEDQNSPICTICHTNAETSAMKGFPPLRSFGVRFDHLKHVRHANCATCHKRTGTGVALSIPSGQNAHATCFQCHSSNANHNMSSCSVCHQPGGPRGTASVFAAAFKKNFSHARHKAMNCSACHSIRRSGSRGDQVSAPVARMHFPPSNVKSCASCHNDKRAFGGDDFSDCKRCHLANTFGFPRQRL